MSVHQTSSPTKNPVEHFYFTIHNPEGDKESFFTYGFGTFTAAQYWLEQLLKLSHKWQDTNTILFRHKSGCTLTLKGSHLEEVVDHTPPKKEEPYEILSNEQRILNKALNFHRGKITIPETKDKIPTPHKKQTVKKNRPQKGKVTVGDMAKELGIPATKARSILRKAKVQKPEQGWSFEAGTSLEAEIFDIIKSGI